MARKWMMVFALWITACGSEPNSKADEVEPPRVAFKAEYVGPWHITFRDVDGDLLRDELAPEIETRVSHLPDGTVLLDDIGECGVLIDPTVPELPAQGCTLQASYGEEVMRIGGVWSIRANNLRLDLTGSTLVQQAGGEQTVFWNATYDATPTAVASSSDGLDCADTSTTVDLEVGTFEASWSQCTDANDYSVDCFRETDVDEPTDYWWCRCNINSDQQSDFMTGPNPRLFADDTPVFNDGCGWSLPSL